MARWEAARHFSPGLRVPLPWRKTGHPGKLGCLECGKEVVAKEETSSRSVVRCGCSWHPAQCPSCLGPASIAHHHHEQLEDSRKAGWGLCPQSGQLPSLGFVLHPENGDRLIKASEHVRSGVCEGRLTVNCLAHSSFNAQRSTRPCQAGF